MAEVRFKYIFPDDYNPVYVNGAYGGAGPRGELAINFYLERAPVPYTEFRDVSPQGVVDPKFTLEPNDLGNIVIRYISSGVIMNLDTAKSVYTWLGEHIKRMEEGTR